MRLEEKKVDFGQQMKKCIAYLTPEESCEKFKELVMGYARDLEVFSECDINNMSDSEYGDILTRLYKITFFSEDFLTCLSDQRRIQFDRIETIMTNMVFEYENTRENAKNDTVYGHLCLNVAVSKGFKLNLKSVYTVDILRSLEREKKIFLYGKSINLYGSMPVAKPQIIESVPQIYSMAMFDKLGDEQELTQSFIKEIECTDIFPFFIEYLQLWFNKRKILKDMKLYIAEFNKQFEEFMNQDNEIVQICKDWYNNSITRAMLQKVNKK